MWMGGGLVPVLVARFVQIFFQNANEPSPHEDRHKAPSSSQPFPLSLQYGERSSFPHQVVKIILEIMSIEGIVRRIELSRLKRLLLAESQV